MNCTLLLHSTTGNTRLLARHAAAVLERAGHTCQIHDIVKDPETPDLAQTDLLLVAAPTMYFRVSYAMELFVARLPAPADGGLRPAVLLGTAGGEPGAHFELLARQLHELGWITLGAHWVMMPNNWPPHRRVARPLASAEPLAAKIAQLVPLSRWLLALAWPDLGLPADSAPAQLERFLLQMLRRAGAGALSRAPAPEALHHGMPGLAALGRRIDVEMMRKATAPRVLTRRCGHCGSCVKVCPVGCVSRADEQSAPVFGDTCTGCWACYNRCPDNAIIGWGVPVGAGQYRSPPVALLRLFRHAPLRGDVY